MLKEVYKNIYLNEITLPDSPLKYLNSYIIKTHDRNLVIDTGFNRPECREVFLDGLKELGIEIAQTDVLITHLHSDHCGLIAELKSLGASILVGEAEEKELFALIGGSDVAYWDRFSKRALMYDLLKYDINISQHPGYTYRPELVKGMQALQEGTVIKYGDYSLQVLFVPGHTRGHIALYEERNKLFFGGDLILDKITPTVTFWGFEQDILKVYLDTLAKVMAMEIDVVFTGHRAILYDCRKRIEELVAHHMKRLEEIKVILEKGEQSVSDVASQMTWDIRVNSWDDFPKTQKWFATGEAMAHLEHLYCAGLLSRREESGKLIYGKK